MLWATRPRCHVDRAACAWLIRRFIDTDPMFVFVDDPDEVPADAKPFDMRGVELGHHHGNCSFETIVAVYTLLDPVLGDIARIVHEADLADGRYDSPEALGIDVAIRALSNSYVDDHALLAVTDRLFDGLYQQRRTAILN